MKKTLEAGAVLSRSEAANEEFAHSAGFDTVERTRADGWDPYEVWRTRVKDEADWQERDSRTA